MALVKGVLEVTVVMLGSANVFAWIIMAWFLAGMQGRQWTPVAPLVALAVLYGLVGFGAGNIMARRHGRAGLVSALLGTTVACGMMLLMLVCLQICSAQLAVMLVLAIPVAAVGGFVGMWRAADRKAGREELKGSIAAPDPEEADGE